jgi:NADH-quinone oxidoreductase subunit J
MKTNLLLLILMLIAALWTVMGRSLLKATISLAITSAVITILMFRLNSPLAAVFELSVCTGLITVIFVSTISLTKPLTHKEITELSKDRIKRFWYLPVIVALVGVGLILMKIRNDLTPSTSAWSLVQDVRSVLWNFRQLDMFGQIIVLIIGALGVSILFEERTRDEW